jgi:hypothetical protein
MKWFIPSWEGDFRLEPIDDKTTKLVIQDPTVAESELLHCFLKSCRRGGRQWIPRGEKILADSGPYRTNATREITLHASLGKIGPVLVNALKPKDRTLTALTFKNGELQVAESMDKEAMAKLGVAAEKKDAKAAASVSRPTPCCPQCEPGAIAPATEVLLSFLDDQEHADWANHRAIIVIGGMTGNRYVLSHRHGAVGKRIGKICYDLDDQQVVHFFDWSVPPEEEVLAAKLILEHREPWLRNEATFFGAGIKFKNPFGGVGDGTETSAFMRGVGIGLRALFGPRVAK